MRFVKFSIFSDIEGDCSFEGGLCGWVNLKGSDHFDWTRHRGCTKSGMTGPCRDHSTGKQLNFSASRTFLFCMG